MLLSNVSIFFPLCAGSRIVCLGCVTFWPSPCCPAHCPCCSSPGLTMPQSPSHWDFEALLWIVLQHTVKFLRGGYLLLLNFAPAGPIFSVPLKRASHITMRLLHSAWLCRNWLLLLPTYPPAFIFHTKMLFVPTGVIEMFSYTAKSPVLNVRFLCLYPNGLLQIHSAVGCLLCRIRIPIIQQYSVSHRYWCVRSEPWNYGLNNGNGGGDWGVFCSILLFFFWLGVLHFWF